MKDKITIILLTYGLGSIMAGFWAGTQNWYAFGLSLICCGFCFYNLIKQ